MNRATAETPRYALSPMRLLRASRYAIHGIACAVRSEPNMRFHLICSAVVLTGCLVVRPGMGMVTLALATCAVVCLVELLNTALESVVDLASEGEHSALAATAKDTAAGAVFVAGLAALGVGCYLLVSTYPWRWRLLSGDHLGGAVESAAGLVAIAWIVWLSRRTPTPLDRERVKEETP